jgi:hypothetical protein
VSEDAFVCRREGHVPTLRITKATPPVPSYTTTCSRCGKIIVVSIPNTAS